MSFRWILHDGAGADLRSTEDFPTQAEAEAWMGTEWESLLAEGGESVTLMDGSEKVYRMGLRES